MFVFRLTTRKYATKLDGIGASFNNNRWNSIGTPMIYTAENRALALAEIVVHLTAATLPNDYVMLTIEIPDSLKITEIKAAQLAVGWNVFPHTLETQKSGDNFIRNGNTAILKVPSAVVHGNYNFLINPMHKGIEKIKVSDIQGFPLDNRFF